MQWASLSDVPQMDTSPKFGTEQGFNILNTILVTSPKISELHKVGYLLDIQNIGHSKRKVGYLLDIRNIGHSKFDIQILVK